MKILIAIVLLATTQISEAMEVTEKSKTDGKISEFSNTINDQSNQIFINNEIDSGDEYDLDESGYVLGEEWNPNLSQWDFRTPGAPVHTSSRELQEKPEIDIDLDESFFVFDRETRERHAKARTNQTIPASYTSKTLEDRHPNDGPENIIDDLNLARGEAETKNPSEKLEYKGGHQTVTEILPDGRIRVADNWIVLQPKPDSTNKAQDNNSSDK